jgi:DNA-binding NarL/FixJ family response regulator
MFKRVALVGNDNHFFTTVKESLLSFIPNIYWLEFNNGFEIINYCLNKKELPEVVITEMFLSKVDGIIVTDYLSTYLPDIRVICVIEELDNNIVSDVTEVGAMGLLTKSNPSFFLKIIYSNDGIYNIKKTTLNEIAPTSAAVSNGLFQYRNILFKNKGITKRESLFLLLNSTGLEFGEIATLMFISRKTVENLFNSVAKKIGVHNRHNLTLFCIRMRLTKFSIVKANTPLNIVYQ